MLSGIATSCVSKCQPLGKSGRMGRSIMRAVSVPFSPERPSRLKNEPGILPAEYMRSSTATVRGRKSTSRRLPTVAVLRTIVSPLFTTTAPEACLAIRPVSNEISLPAISTETVVTASLLICSAFPAGPGWPQRFSLRPCANRVSLAKAVERRRGGGARAQGLADVLADLRGDLRVAAVALKAVDVEAELLAARPQVRVVDVALVGVQRVVEGPERALARGGLRGERQWHRALVLGAQREMAEGDAHVVAPLEVLGRDRAARAREVAVEDRDP